MTALHISAEELAPKGYRRPRPATPIVPRERVMSRVDRMAIQAAEDARLKELRAQRLLEAMERHKAYYDASVLFLSLSVRLDNVGILWSWGMPAVRTTPIRERLMGRARCIAKSYGVGLGDIFANTRNARSCRARHHFVWWVRHNTDWSMPKIGRFLGGRDHTTILHSIRMHQKRIDNGELPSDADPEWWPS